MGWLKEKYTKAYFVRRDANGELLPYGVDGIEWWEKGEIYPPARTLLDGLNLAGARVLDIGHGRGEAVRHCLRLGAAFVCGIDFAEPAHEIAIATLEPEDPSKYRLVNADALEFFEAESLDAAYDVVLMLDVIEHITRPEVDRLMPLVMRALVPGGCCVVHTPFFAEDDDVLVTGGKANCKDSSDTFDETRGMHINRYCESGLGEHLAKHGFIRKGPYYFVRPGVAARLTPASAAPAR